MHKEACLLNLLINMHFYVDLCTCCVYVCTPACVQSAGDGNQQTPRHQVSQSETAEREGKRQLLLLVCIRGGPALMVATPFPTLDFCLKMYLLKTLIVLPALLMPVSGWVKDVLFVGGGGC